VADHRDPQVLVACEVLESGSPPDSRPSGASPPLRGLDLVELPQDRFRVVLVYPNFRHGSGSSQPDGRVLGLEEVLKGVNGPPVSA